MKTMSFVSMTAVLGASLAVISPSRAQTSRTLAAPVRVVVQTEAGEIELEVDTEKAPRTAANFLRYVDAGHYDGGTFHRTVKMDNQPDRPVKIEGIQAGVEPGDASPLPPQCAGKRALGAPGLTALLLPHIFPICSVVAPCQRGASPPSVLRRTFATGS